MIIKKRIIELINLLILALGTLLVVTGSSLLTPSKEILFGIGTSFIASTIISFITLRYYDNVFKLELICKEWGLTQIYKLRTETNEKVNKIITDGARNIDCIVQGGLTSLRQNLNIKLENRIKEGLKLRILISDQKSNIYTNIKVSNDELVKWYYCLKPEIKTNVEIREYSGVPQDLYFRVDNVIKIGPYLIDRTGSQTITYEYDTFSKGGIYYSDYFDDLWSKSKVVKEI